MASARHAEAESAEHPSEIRIISDFSIHYSRGIHNIAMALTLEPVQDCRRGLGVIDWTIGKNQKEDYKM